MGNIVNKAVFGGYVVSTRGDGLPHTLSSELYRNILMPCRESGLEG